MVTRYWSSSYVLIITSLLSSKKEIVVLNFWNVGLWLTNILMDSILYYVTLFNFGLQIPWLQKDFLWVIKHAWDTKGMRRFREGRPILNEKRLYSNFLNFEEWKHDARLFIFILERKILLFFLLTLSFFKWKITKIIFFLPFLAGESFKAPSL